MDLTGLVSSGFLGERRERKEITSAQLSSAPTAMEEYLNSTHDVRVCDFRISDFGFRIPIPIEKMKMKDRGRDERDDVVSMLVLSYLLTFIMSDSGSNLNPNSNHSRKPKKESFIHSIHS